MKFYSLNARTAFDAENSEEVEVALFEITHPDLDAPVRLSTDPTERLSTNPLVYGTRSTWRGANPITEPFHFIIASTILPSDQANAPAYGTLQLDNVDSRVTKIMRSFRDLASVSMAVVLASSPNDIEAQYLDLDLMVASIELDSLTLTFSREEIELEFFPSGRMSSAFFPGLYA